MTLTLIVRTHQVQSWALAVLFGFLQWKVPISFKLFACNLFFLCQSYLESLPPVKLTWLKMQKTLLIIEKIKNTASAQLWSSVYKHECAGMYVYGRLLSIKVRSTCTVPSWIGPVWAAQAKNLPDCVTAESFYLWLFIYTTCRIASIIALNHLINV